MRKIKIVAVLLGIVLVIGLVWAGLTSRKSARASAPPAPGRTELIQREMDETSRIVNGQRR
jgi:hypothetical protein